jgi:PcfJ-like protein
MGVQSQVFGDAIFSEPDTHQPMVKVESRCGSLFIEWPGGLMLSQLTSWETGLRLLNRREGDWEDTTVFQTIWLDLFEGWGGELKDWLNAIPEDLLEISAGFCHYRLPILQLAARYSVVADLLRSTPNLLVVWYDYCRDHQYTVAQLVAGLQQSQRALLRSMGLVDRKSTIKFLRKLSFSRLNRHDCQRVRGICGDQIILEKMAHSPWVSDRYLLVLGKLPRLAGSQLLWLLAGESLSMREVLEATQLINDCIRMGGERAAGYLCQLTSLEAIGPYHDRLVEQFNNDYINQVSEFFDEDLPFPVPPFMGNSYIQPVTNNKQLREVGVAMAHCVGSYVDQVFSGSYCVYQMHTPEAVTIGLKRDGSWHFRVDQIRGYGNSKPSPKAQSLVDAWLNESVYL